MIVYICSRFQAKNACEQDKNYRTARDLGRRCMESGATPIIPHLVFPQFMDDRNRDERRTCLQACLELVQVCDEIWYFAGDGISDGMKMELYEAMRLGRKIVRIDPGHAVWRSKSIPYPEIRKEIAMRAVG